MRCAIYTRKSSSEGLQKDFNSLDAQREACVSYIASQRSEGWIAIESVYDDGGYSGGTLQRPALKLLMRDVEADRVDVVVVYKIDRLSRSLKDFVELVGLFEKNKVTFVAVTQSFNTTSSMGRLTLNVLLSFAQFEREITSERLKDKFAASRARGMWTNNRPFGYRAERCLLSVDHKEAEVVRYIYKRYPTIGSCRLLADELTSRGHLNRNGSPFSKVGLARMLKNRLYRGDIVYNGVTQASGLHEAIVSEADWTKAQKALAQSARRRAARRRPPVNGMLKGLLFDVTGHAMVHTFLHSKGRLYRYYVSTTWTRRKYGPGTDASGRFRAADLEAGVVSLFERLTGIQPQGAAMTPIEVTGLVRRLVARIDILKDGMRVTLHTGAILLTAAAGKIR